MPSTATITSFYTFAAGTKARSSQVNANFDNFRGHLLPIEPLTMTASNISYDLGSSEYSWRTAFLETVSIRGSTSTNASTFKGRTDTSGGFDFMIGGATVSSFTPRGPVSPSPFLMYTTITASDTGSFGTAATTASQSVTNMVLSITPKKNSNFIEIGLEPLAAGGYLNLYALTSTVAAECRFTLYRDTVTSSLGIHFFAIQASALTGTVADIKAPVSSMRWYDNPGFGTFTYFLHVVVTSAQAKLDIVNTKMRVTEW